MSLRISLGDLSVPFGLFGAASGFFVGVVVLVMIIAVAILLDYSIDY